MAVALKRGGPPITTAGGFDGSSYMVMSVHVYQVWLFYVKDLFVNKLCFELVKDLLDFCNYK